MHSATHSRGPWSPALRTAPLTAGGHGALHCAQRHSHQGAMEPCTAHSATHSMGPWSPALCTAPLTSGGHGALHCAQRHSQQGAMEPCTAHSATHSRGPWSPALRTAPLTASGREALLLNLTLPQTPSTHPSTISHRCFVRRTKTKTKTNKQNTEENIGDVTVA